MEKPLVSIIVPAYNVEAYLGECLESVLAQTYDNFELIVIDDASTDNTPSIIDTYQSKDGRIRAVHMAKNLGPSVVRNKGLDLSRGKYILFVDGDDLIAENLLSETVSCSEKYALDEVLFGYKTFSLEQGLKWTVQSKCTENNLAGSVLNGKAMIVLKEQMRKQGNISGVPVAPWAWLYNRLFLKKNNLRFLEGVINEDVLFWFQCCIHAKRVVVIDKELYFYRRNTGSITKGWRDNRAKSMFSVIVAVYAEWIKNTFSKEENEAIATFIMGKISNYKMAVLRGETKDITISPAFDFGYKFLRGQIPYVFGSLPTNVINSLLETDNIFVYGAGSVAADVFDQLYQSGITPTGVMVSYKNGNTETFGGVPVKTLDEWGFVDNATVIVAVTKMYREGIVDELKKYGYENIVFIEEEK